MSEDVIPHEEPVEPPPVDEDESQPAGHGSDVTEMLGAGEFAIVGFKYMNQKADVKIQIRLTSGNVITIKIEGSQVPPQPELMQALHALRPDLAREAEVSLSPENEIAITQIVRGYKNGKHSYKIIGLRARGKSRNPMVIQSDLKWDAHPDDLQTMDAETVHKLDTAFNAVAGYVQLHLQTVGEPDLFGQDDETVLDRSGAKVSNGVDIKALKAAESEQEELPSGDTPF